jgi:hypothetical protein
MPGWLWLAAGLVCGAAIGGGAVIAYLMTWAARHWAEWHWPRP